MVDCFILRLLRNFRFPYGVLKLRNFYYWNDYYFSFSQETRAYSVLLNNSVK